MQLYSTELCYLVHITFVSLIIGFLIRQEKCLHWSLCLESFLNTHAILPQPDGSYIVTGTLYNWFTSYIRCLLLCNKLPQIQCLQTPFILSELLCIRNKSRVLCAGLSWWCSWCYHSMKAQRGKDLPKPPKCPLWIAGLGISAPHKHLMRGFPVVRVIPSFSSHRGGLCHLNKHVRRARERVRATQNSVFFNLVTEEMAHYFCLIPSDGNHLLSQTNTWQVGRNRTKWRRGDGHYWEPGQKCSIMPSMSKKRTWIGVCTHRILAKKEGQGFLQKKKYSHEAQF